MLVASLRIKYVMLISSLSNISCLGLKKNKIVCVSLFLAGLRDVKCWLPGSNKIYAMLVAKRRSIR